MESVERKPAQGVTNIVRFNWQYYVIAIVLVTAIFLTKHFFPPSINTAATVISFLAIAATFVSLGVSYCIYDRSNLYSLKWLDKLSLSPNANLVNINAGFDETSSLLAKKFPNSNLVMLDFYDPKKHTEISVERARKAYSIFPGTKTVNTNAIPLAENSVDCIFLIFAAHEIRNDEERILFFKQLKQALRADGKLILVEHLRDFNNFIAYNFGFFHFHSKRTWRKTISQAGLMLENETKHTPFISIFTLRKNGTPA